jgi:D-arginine dehydrogenase
VSQRFDIAIIGAGMAGASLAAEVAPHASVVLLEGEAQPGYHSTGRSAAFWSETYGGPFVQPLTTASKQLLEAPDPAFSEQPFLSPRGALHIADAGGEAALDDLLESFGGSVQLHALDRAELAERLPMLGAGWDRAVAEPSCADIDVAALHAAYLRSARRNGTTLLTNAEVVALAREGGGWRISTKAGRVAADIVVNAAGAWADPIARLAGAQTLGIRPYRRTLVQLALFPSADPAMPLVMDASERFYFKPEAGGRLWLSPHDETPCDPCDAAPEELDTAIAIDRFEQAVDWPIARIERRWAGLRSFAPDRLPVYGFDAEVDGFFWCAGQGGFGIQTAPAAAKLAAALLLGRNPGPIVAAIDPAPYAPARFTN